MHKGFYKKTVRDVPLDGQLVLVRADYNVPLTDKGTVDDDYRLRRSMPTIQYLLGRNCRVIICSHLGRPGGKVVPELSLEPVAARASELLNIPVGFVPACIGDRVRQAAKRLTAGQVLLLENLRFHPEEEANDEHFAQQLAKDSLAGYFVQDGFAVVHRKHASTAAITQFLPSVAGLLLESEVTTISSAMKNPKHPLVAILGGAKVSDKIKVIERLVEMADQIIIGGAMANTFLRYKKLPIGKSLYEEGQESEIQRIYSKALEALRGKTSVDEFLMLPTDAVVAPEAEADAPAAIVPVTAVPDIERILDLGPDSAARALEALKTAATVIWNGPLGLAEVPTYAHASARVAAALNEQKDTTYSLVGGGDTADFVLKWCNEHHQEFGYISTGGGASIDLMADLPLPGVESLLDA